MTRWMVTAPSGRYNSAMPPSARDRILNAAEERLLSIGPGGLVLDAVAADAGVSKGGLLYHFRSKEALVAGLCDRMLEGFDRALAGGEEAEASTQDDPSGAFARAYLASTVTGEGKAADNSAQVMAGLLATLGRESEHLEVIRLRFAAWQARLLEDGLDDTTATIVRLAADGLWLSALLGLPTLDPDLGARTLRALQDMTRPSRSGA